MGIIELATYDEPAAAACGPSVPFMLLADDEVWLLFAAAICHAGIAALDPVPKVLGLPVRGTEVEDGNGVEGPSVCPSLPPLALAPPMEPTPPTVWDAVDGGGMLAEDPVAGVAPPEP